MQTIKILIAEDQASDLELYSDAIDDFNKDSSDYNIQQIICKTKEEALSKIKNQYFDAAFIDLNLSNSVEDEGKELIEAIQNNARYPIYIVSGQIHKIDHEFNNKFISKHDKDTVNTNELLLDIKKIYVTGLTKVLGSKGLLEKYLNDIFWNHFSESKEHWINHSHNGTKLEKIISRYTLIHLLEYFQLDDDGNEIKTYDPSEMYIKPMIKDEIYPGTILVYEEEKYLVLSPACDISNKKCDCVILIKLTELFKHELLVDIKEKKELHISTDKEEFSKGERTNYENTLKSFDKNIKRKLESFISNKNDRYYFLPQFLDFKAKIIDFQDISTVDISEIGSYDKYMTISVPFLKDIQSKFSSYYARQGSPDFDFSIITEQYYTSFLER